MPYEVRKHKDGSYEVVNTVTGAVKARHTDQAKAEKQVRLLHAVEHGWKPRRRK
jgi:hypothetical protein